LPNRFYLHGCAYSVGLPLTIETLLKEGALSPESYEDCTGRGITTFCVADRGVEAMSAVSIGRTMETARFSADQIDCVVVAHSTSCDSDPADSIRELGSPLGPGAVVLQGRDCAAFATALQMATERITEGPAKNVLLVLTGHVPPGTPRYSPQFGTVFGDGAATCIVSSSTGSFEILSIESGTRDTGPRAAPGAAPSGDEMLRDFQRLRNLLSVSYECAGISPADVSTLFGTHGSQIYLELMAEAAEVPYESVYDRALRELGHVFSCDNIIDLAHFSQHHARQRDRVLCLIGWSPLAAGVVLLKEVER
jgi:3-oxoacyl-[acyl-carrier-protein] synthase III